MRSGSMLSREYALQVTHFNRVFQDVVPPLVGRAVGKSWFHATTRHPDRERFDVVIADPPAFIKRKKDLKNGEAAYRRLNEAAMRLLNKDGILVSASCSMHLPEDDLQNILLTSARHLDRNIQLLERGAQGPDHPVHPAILETRYIKSLTCRLLPNS